MTFSSKLLVFLMAMATAVGPELLRGETDPVPTQLRFRHMFGVPGDAPGSFRSASGIDELSDGRAVIFDMTRIQLCELNGACSAFGSRGTEPGQFALNGGTVAVDGLDRIVVADTYNWRVQVCHTAGDCAVMGREGMSTPDFGNVGTFFYPASVDVDRHGRIWVGSRAYHQVQVCDFDGNCDAYGEPFLLCSDAGCQESSFYFDSTVSDNAFHVHVDRFDRVYVSRPQYYVDNILVCDQAEVPRCEEFGPRGGGDGVGEFSYPGPMDSDAEGLLYVVDWGNHRVQVCNVDSGQCRAAGSMGDGPGQFLQLRDLSVRRDGLLSTVEFINGRVQLFSIRQAAPFSIDAGLNDAWYNPATDGQGFFINVFKAHGTLFLSWFTYETDTRDELAPVATVGEPYHRWLTAQGPMSGNTAQLDVVMTSGGVFTDSRQVVNTAPGEYGSIAIEFHDCWNATLTYDLHAVGEAGEIPITRVVPDNGRVCEIMDFQ